MLYQWLRVVHSDNGVLTDCSLLNQDENSSLTLDLVTSEDYIYIAQQFPFNNVYIKSNVANDVTGTLSIDYWDGSNWRAAVDILDGTSVGGVPLAQSGVVQFSPSKSYGWYIVDDTSETYAPTELQSITMYNLYWIRLKYSATLKATTSINKITYAFTTHQQIDNLDTTINSYLPSFDTGKTSWEDEIITASSYVLHDLKRNNIVINRGQILRLEDVTLAANWRTLMHIYRILGGDYTKKYEIAEKEYKNALDLQSFSVDLNNNAFLEQSEMNINYRVTRV